MSELPSLAQQQELIGLLQHELNDMLEFDYAGLVAQDLLNRVDLLEELQLHCSNLGNAANLVGLTGLRDACQHLVRNFTAFAAAPERVPVAALELFQGWCPLLLNYLAHFGQAEEQTAIELFLEYARASQWLVPLSPEQLAQMRQDFSSSEVLVDEPGVLHNLPDFIDEDFISLRIDADVNRDLLDGLLVELPEQSDVFAQAIERLVRHHDSQGLAAAQRIAHTIKGAANVVGIRGVANLMHYLEDILDQLVKEAQVKPLQLPAVLQDLLEDCADCLATMTEYLTGLGPPPEHSQDVLERVIAWLRQDGSAVVEPLPAEMETLVSPPEVPHLEEPLQSIARFEHENLQEPTPEEDVETRHQLGVSDATAYELLRLAGENQIATNQVLTRINYLVDGVKSADSYHQKIRALAQDVEKLVQSQAVLGVAAGAAQVGDLDPLEMERYNELHSYSNQLQELTTDAHEAILTLESQLKELANLVVEQRQRSSEAQSILLQIRMLPVSLITPRLTRCVRQASRLTHKSVAVEILGDEVLVDSRVLNMVVDPLMHILRNAVDHGIESSAQQRAAQGKPAEGRIRVEFLRRGESLRIHIQDDGQGFDYGRIEQLARERGFLEPYEQASRNELHKILLTPGFSTRQHISQTSGRGIGLDVVQTQLRLLKGVLSMQSDVGKGCTFILDMPMSILSAHTLLVRMGGFKFSVVSRPLNQIIYIQNSDVQWHLPVPRFQLGAEALDVLCLDDIAMVPGVTKPDHYGALLIVDRPEGGRVAVAVESVVASEEQIIKPLNKYACKPAGVIGAAILGDGSISPVLDLQDLPTLQMTQPEYQRWLRAKDEMQARFVPPAPKPMALVVDDSLSARRSLAQFMSDLGMDVRTAKDGFEAIALMEKQTPNLLLVDLEMPRMNGLELTAHVRASAQRNLPIIMVTSRITEKHKQLASAAGVNAYLNKPWSEEELMRTIQSQLGEPA